MSLGLATVPPQVSKLLTRKEQLRILRENVMLIVRDYNNIKHTIEDKEVPLFQEHLGRLDAQILPGIRKYTWVSSADAFVNHCRSECKKVFEEVKAFQGNVQKIFTEFDKITKTNLTNIEKVLYLLPNFIRTQDAVMKQKEGEFIAGFERISAYVMDTYELFLRKKTDVQKQWLIFMEDLDDKLKGSLQSSVKSTLMQFGKHIMGDKGQDTELVAIFTVYTILNIDVSDKWNIVHEPTHDDLKLQL